MQPATNGRSPSAPPIRIIIPSGAEWNNAWAQLSAQPHSPATDEAAGAALQKTRRERSRARPRDRVAGKKPSPAHRMAACRAARLGHRRSRRCGRVAEYAACARARGSRSRRDGRSRASDRGRDCPDVQQLVQNDPVGARSHANQLLRVLGRDGEYEAGVDFASGLPESIRAEMLGTAFQYWAEAQPERALDVALKLSAGDTRKTALDAAISGWAQGDPSGLAEFALKLPSPPPRTAPRPCRRRSGNGSPSIPQGRQRLDGPVRSQAGT